MRFFEFTSGVMLVVTLIVLVVKGFALVSALRYSERAYDAAGKLTKVAWSIILALGFLAQVILPGSPIGLINIAFTIAALVYLADVRPALREVTGRR